MSTKLILFVPTSAVLPVGAGFPGQTLDGNNIVFTNVPTILDYEGFFVSRCALLDELQNLTLSGCASYSGCDYTCKMYIVTFVFEIL